MIAYTALAGAAGIVVLNAKPLENPGTAVIHGNRQGNMQFAEGLAQQLMHSRVQLQQFGSFIQLLLGHFKRIETCLERHDRTSL